MTAQDFPDDKSPGLYLNLVIFHNDLYQMALRRFFSPRVVI